MVCCGKKRKDRAKKVMKRRIFEIKSQATIKNFKTKDPTILTDQGLINSHNKIHTLYNTSIKFNPPNKKFINHVVSLHVKFVDEMNRRKMKHTSPIKHL